MTTAGKSVFYFGIYLAIVGLLFLAIPAQLVALLNLPSLPDGWARVIGLLVLIIATCDVIAGRTHLLPLLRASVYIRLLFTAAVVLLVISRQMPATTVLFGAIDAAGALWTAVALRRENTSKKEHG